MRGKDFLLMPSFCARLPRAPVCTHVRGHRRTQNGFRRRENRRERKVRSMISMLLRRSRDLYLCLTVKQEKIECQERVDGFGDSKKKGKRGRYVAGASAQVPPAWLVPSPLPRSRTGVQAHTLSRSWPRRTEERRKENKESREDHY